MKLEIRNLSKKFGNNHAIDAMTLPLIDCQTLAIIGPSGGGKSTLLRLIGGLEYPDTGTILLDGEPILFEEKALRIHRRKLGFVFQSWNLFPNLTALENICLPLQYVHGLTEEQAREKGTDLLKRFAMEKHGDKKPYELSGGQVQRAALIRAVAINPKLLLLDEPTSALDPLMTVEVLELILELKGEGRDLILVTHHINFARKLADSILFLHEGKLLESQRSGDFFEHPHDPFVQKYLSKVLTY